MSNFVDMVAREARDIERKRFVIRSIKACGSLARGPRPIQQRQIAVMKDIEEIDQRRVVPVLLALTCNLGDVNRQRSVWP